MQELFDDRLEGGFHDVLTLAALLDPELYPYVHTIPMAERVKAEELVMKLYGSSKSFGKAALGQAEELPRGQSGDPRLCLAESCLSSRRCWLLASGETTALITLHSSTSPKWPSE